MYLFRSRLLGALRAILFVVLVAVTLGCTQEASEEQVTPMVEEYFATMKAKDFDKLLTFYHEDFFNAHPAGEWVEYLKDVRATLGEIESLKLKQSQVNTVLTGRRFIYEYSVKYEKGFAKEMVMFFQDIGGTEIKVQMHRIDSRLLQAGK